MGRKDRLKSTICRNHDQCRRKKNGSSDLKLNEKPMRKELRQLNGISKVVFIYSTCRKLLKIIKGKITFI